MAVFPDSMNRLNVEDTQGSLRQIEAYISYMVERIEFSNRNVTRQVSEAGVSSVELYQMILELANQQASINATLNQLSGRITGLEGSISSVTEQIAGINTSISTINGTLSSLDARVTALETKDTGTGETT